MSIDSSWTTSVRVSALVSAACLIGLLVLSGEPRNAENGLASPTRIIRKNSSEEGVAGGHHSPQQRIFVEEEGDDGPVIPFYIYPLEMFPSFWGPKSTCRRGNILIPKHDEEIHALNAMKRHPWRVYDPSKAKIAYLPVSLDIHKRGGCPGLNDNVILEEIKAVVENSTIYPMTRHVFIKEDWMSMSKLVKKVSNVLGVAGIAATMEGRSSCSTSLPYSSNYATLFSLRSPDTSQLPDPKPLGSSRTVSVNMVGQFDDRTGYKERKALFIQKGEPIPNAVIVYSADLNVLRKKGISTRACASRNDTDRCIQTPGWPDRMDTQSIVESSNYTLALRGDTPGSDRWVNGIAAGTAMIQVSLEKGSPWDWHPFPCAVPWKDIVKTIPRVEFMSDPTGSVNKLLSSIEETELLEIQRRTLYHAADVDWNAHNPRVLENFLHLLKVDGNFLASSLNVFPRILQHLQSVLISPV